ncbi:aquaporin-like protein [Delitschia confertaspora ATCC 74209]|uniref:Aquaporin-like protein n=1 Tax=Delitschia confertaspora ATCC 74209 TaxID=1513339 RepID=A0A9P4K0G0_9PLEO|nr:aquaporin-like protein [Delitschia confertaspora ATCC 74209]
MVLPGMKPSYTTDPQRPGEKRLAGTGWLPNRVRNMIVSMLGEYVGTCLFLFFAFTATQVANLVPALPGGVPNLTVLLYIALAFGFSLAVNVWVFFRISGGLFNPAVSLAMALIGAIGWGKALLLILSQITGAITAAAVVSALFPGPMVVRTRLNPYTSVIRGLFIEVLLTAELVFTILMLAAEKHKGTFLAPIGIGLALFIAELAGVFFTGGSLNPARSFGPDVILGQFDGYHWIYWVGPFLGSILAVLFYRLVKGLEYENANPGADTDGTTHTRDGATEPRGAEYFDSHNQARRTDGAADSPAIPFPQFEPKRSDQSDLEAGIPVCQARSAGQHFGDVDLPAPVPTRTHASPLYNLGGDATYSEESLEKRTRPRAQHSHSLHDNRSHLSTGVRSSILSRRIRDEEDGIEMSYRRGPAVESGSGSSEYTNENRGRTSSSDDESEA